jgi:hypothetical protein
VNFKLFIVFHKFVISVTVCVVCQIVNLASCIRQSEISSAVTLPVKLDTLRRGIKDSGISQNRQTVYISKILF